MSRSNLRSIGVACGLALTCSLGVSAWEGDVHFGLTKALALEAGFDPYWADVIARGDVGSDSSWVTDPIFTTALSCTSRDATGANVVHDYHFPSQILVPEIPDKRNVEPGKVWRDGVVRTPPAGFRDGDYLAFGRYLHALQDSYSHSGVPDVPTGCEDFFAWGHTKAMGGWTCHLADLTYYHRNVVDAMAQATFNALIDFKNAQNPKNATNTKSSVPVPATFDLKGFADAKSKWEKDAWFTRKWSAAPHAKWFKGAASLDFLQGLSIPDCADRNSSCQPYPFNKVAEQWAQRPRAGFTGPANSSIATTVLQILDAIMNDKIANLKVKIDNGLAEMAFARSLNLDSCPGMFNKLTPLIFAKGFFQSTNTANPNRVCEVAVERMTNKRPMTCAEAQSIADDTATRAVRRGPSAAEVRNALPPAGREDSLYDFTLFPHSGQAEGRETFTALARFIHLPADALWMTLTRQGQDNPWTLTEVLWVPRQ